MRVLSIFSGILLGWLAQQTQAQPGLKGDYYDGTNFERKVFSRIDPQINFDWSGRSPGADLKHSYYSVRWTGKLLAPTTGRYTFSARVDDGIRVWVGNKLVMDSWQLNDSRNFIGFISLVAGRYYDLRVEYFNDIYDGEIELYWKRPNDKKSAIPDNSLVPPNEPVGAQYFFRNVPTVLPVAVVKPAPKPVLLPPKISPKRLVVTTPKPKRPLIHPPSTAPDRAVRDTTASEPAPVRPTVSTAPDGLMMGEAFVLRRVQFEQSSYTLLPESSAELDKLVNALKQNPHWRIEVVGHTDNVGDPRLNLALSENRAKVVAMYLRKRGIADERITTAGQGGIRPLADNATEPERSLNRRVEITIR